MGISVELNLGAEAAIWSLSPESEQGRELGHEVDVVATAILQGQHHSRQLLRCSLPPGAGLADLPVLAVGASEVAA